jgi:hypothetical protein
MRQRIKRLVTTVTALARDPRIPRPIRWLLALAFLPIPGPFDEAIGLIALGLIALFWRPVLNEIRQRAAETAASTEPSAGSGSTVTFV